MTRLVVRAQLLGSVAGVLALMAASSAAAPPTGLHGYVRRGLIMPVCFEGIPCDGPAAGVVLTFIRGDGRIGKVTTRETGFYRIRLPAGRYSVRANKGFTPFPQPDKVRVRAGHDDRLDFYIDTGIQ